MRTLLAILMLWPLVVVGQAPPFLRNSFTTNTFPNTIVARTVAEVTNGLNYANLRASATNQFLIDCQAGTFNFTNVNQPLFLSNYVSIRGAGKYLTEFVTATDGQLTGEYITSPFIIPRGHNAISHMSLTATNRIGFSADNGDDVTTLVGTLFDADTEGDRSKDTTNVVFEALRLTGINALAYVHNGTATFPFSVDWVFRDCDFFSPRDGFLWVVDSGENIEAIYGFTPVSRARLYNCYFKAFYNKLDPIYTNGMARAVGAHDASNNGFLEFHNCVFDVSGGTTNSIGIIHGNTAGNLTTNGGPSLKLFNCDFRVSSTNSPGSNNVYSVSNFLGRLEAYGCNFGDSPVINAGGGVFINPERKTILSVNSAVGNVGAGEDDLHTSIIPKLTLNATNQVLTIFAAGSTAANANNKQIRVRLGAAGTGTLIYDSGAVAINAGEWKIEGSIQYITATSAKAYIGFQNSTATLGSHVDYSALTIGWHTNLTIRITGEATGNNDIVCETSRVEFVGVGGF